MAQLKFGSAGVSAREIDLSGPVQREPVGEPAGVIGTALKGPAFVPVTVAIKDDFDAKFGASDGKKFGPLSAYEWLRNAQALTYLRVLGIGDGRQRAEDGSVTSAGFTVGTILPRSSDGALSGNEYANSGTLGSPLGRTYFLGAFMSESAGSTVFSSAGLQGLGSVTPGSDTAVPIVRGILMAPSGVILRLSSSAEYANDQPDSTLVASEANAKGGTVGSVILMDGAVAKSDFVMLLNGHKGTDPLYPNVITASFDMTSPNYFVNVLNTDPYKLQQAGHYLYASWDVHPATAVVTGSGLITAVSGAAGTAPAKSGVESAAFLSTGSLPRNTGNSYVPNYESFTDRFSHAKSPWIISQKFGGKATNLFRLHAIDAGAGLSTMYKISVENIVPSTDQANQYGTFDLVIRDWNDRDMAQRPLEQFRGLTLDTMSDRYIAKIIGDANVYFDFDRAETAQKIIMDGNYPAMSNLVRVEMDPTVDAGISDPTALPMGFRGIAHLMTSGSMPIASASSSQITDDYLKRMVTPPLPMRTNITRGSGQKIQENPQLYWGAQFEHVTSLSTPNASTLKNDSMKAFAKFFPDFSTTNQNFIVGDNAGEADTAQNGIIDSDRFCHNMFTLENVQVVTGSTTLADPNSWSSATYVRTGDITANDTTKTRAFKVEDLIQANRKFAKFSLIMQGGFDGVNIFDRDAAEINDFAVTADMNDTNRGRENGANVRAYAKAIEIMQNTVNTDIQLLTIPGIRHPIVTDTASDAVRERFDAVYIMDIEQRDNNDDEVFSESQLTSVTNTTRQLVNRGLDNNFVAAYFPDVLITDSVTKTNVVVPPSVVVLGALALNDKIGHPWFAPAGMTRGALSTTLEAKVKLSKTDMDMLYDSNINPLVAFPGKGQGMGGLDPQGGVVVWGQKTMQASASALDRLNARRLLINIRRQARDIAQTITFEPNRQTTLARFSAAIKPRLERIQAQSGLERFSVVIDASTTTQQDIENNTIRGKIYVQPTKTTEFVSLDFVVANNIPQP